jgi:3-oxoacyl-(acyl-carrier-protein) synthase
VFPETVFNAPASHLATYLGSKDINYTLIGDPGTFLQGLAVAADWLEDQRVDAALLVGAEEIDWLVSGAQHLFDPEVIVSEGAGSLLLQRAEDAQEGIGLEALTQPVLFSTSAQRIAAAQAVRQAIGGDPKSTLLVDSLTGGSLTDRAESAAWSDWEGPRGSIKRLLGESFAAGSAWQCVLAVDALAQGKQESAVVSVVGCNQQAIAARFG